MTLIYRQLFPALWLAWVVYWMWASRGNKLNERREPLASRLLHVVPLLIAVSLLWPQRSTIPLLDARIVPRAAWQFWTGAFLTASGLLFTVWARVHLGRNWSGIVTIKQEHELIVSGPYAITRHPIYTGLLLAFIGSALARDEWRGVLGVLIAWLALWRKLRLEERWMTERFGEQYVAYRQCVPALVPTFRRRSS